MWGLTNDCRRAKACSQKYGVKRKCVANQSQCCELTGAKPASASLKQSSGELAFAADYSKGVPQALSWMSILRWNVLDFPSPSRPSGNPDARGDRPLELNKYISKFLNQR